MVEFAEPVRRARIREEDRVLVVDTLKAYINLEHMIKGENGIISPLKKEEREIKTFSFLERYAQIYHNKILENDSEKRSGYVQAINKIARFSRSPFYVSESGNNGLSICKFFLGIEEEKKREVTGSKKKKKIKPYSLPRETFFSWVRSLDHLKEKLKSKSLEEKSKDYRIGRYLRISGEHLRKTNAATGYFLELLASEGAVYRIEDFMFNLIKRKGTTKDKVSQYYHTLKKIPIDGRELIENARDRVPPNDLSEVDRDIYNLLESAEDLESTGASLASILYSLDRYSHRDYKDDLKKSSPLLKRIMKDKGLMKFGRRKIEELVDTELFTKKKLIVPYMEVLADIVELENTSLRERVIYSGLSAELFKDYLLEERKEYLDIEEIKEKCYNSINSLTTLEEETRKKSLKILRKSLKRLNRKIRINTGTNYLPADGLVASISSSYSLDSDKANFIFESLLRKNEIPRRENVKN